MRGRSICVQAAPASDALERLSDLFEDVIVLLCCEQMPRCNGDCHGPLDDLEGDHQSHHRKVGDLLGSRNGDGTDDR